MIKKIRNSVVRFKRDEAGDFTVLVWTIGGLVIAVAIIMIILRLAPDTAENLWNTVWDYVTGQLGL